VPPSLAPIHGPYNLPYCTRLAIFWVGSPRSSGRCTERGGGCVPAGPCFSFFDDPACQGGGNATPWEVAKLHGMRNWALSCLVLPLVPLFGGRHTAAGVAGGAR